MNSKYVIKRILVYIKPYRAMVAGGFILAVLAVTFNLLGPVFVGKAIDNVLGAGKVDFKTIAFYLILLLISIAFAALAQWLLSVCTRKISAYTARDMRLDAFKGANNAPLITLDNYTAGDTVSRMVNDAEYVGEGVLQALTQFLPGVVTIVGTLAVMLLQSPPIAILVFIITPISVIFASVLAKKTAHLFRMQAKIQGELSGYVSEMVGASEVVNSFGYEKNCFDKFDKINESLAGVSKKSVFCSSISNPGTRFVNSIVYAAVCVVGALLVLSARITIGQLSCFLTYSNQYTKPFNEISGVITQLQAAIAAAQRLIDVIDIIPEQADLSTSEELTVCSGDVLMRNVSFSYTIDKPLIQNFNLDVKAGQRVAIVGPTGCGKTTLINLLMRFYEINEGNILVDKKNIQTIKRESLRSQYGMVLQDTWLKNDTVRENIAFGKPNASDEEILTASKAVHAHSFIKRLPKGYDTVIATGGGNLSAGQRQLLCIARIMLMRPQMLILDEATSSIDTRTEILVQQAFEKLMSGRTSFIVAHRLSTIQSANIIIVMKDGKIIEKGTHAELLAGKGFYEKLYKSQFEGA